ncbi:MAG: phosphate/phosphite/phosphonate ABC transporter substrate-binding protein [Nitrospirae bacterium]|nr:phosphate/phosphite/phosphonate ABC transporter substrate-binding protein [Nitrospirota bacterium]
MKSLRKFFSLLLIIFSAANVYAAEAEDIVFAVSPMASPAATASSFSEFIDYLSRKLNKKVILKQRRKYSEVNELLKTGKASVAYTCTGAYLAGRQDFGLELLAVPLMKGKATYNSYIIVHKDSRVNSLKDLKGKIFAFTDPLSLSGRLYVTSLLNEDGILTKDYFRKTFYTAGHEKSIEAVAAGLADGASVDSLILDDMLKKGNPYAERVRIISVSQPFGIPPFVVSPEFSLEDRKGILMVLLNMSKEVKGKEILQKIGIDGFVLPDHAAYLSAHEIKKRVRE